jgi:hypothetical protein
VIPALNEESNLPLVLENLPRVDEVIIVDGGSADDTVAIAREVRPDARVVRQTRSGKGNALVCGFAASRGDIVVTLNADGSTDPGEIPRYVDALLAGAEVAHGSRFRDGGGNLGGHRLDRLGNAILSRMVNMAFGTRFTDLGYGYNAYWRTLLPVLDLPPVDVPGLKRGRRVWGDGPEIEPLINIRTAAQGMRVVEIASVGYPRIHGVRERQRLRRALRALRAAWGEYIRRWRIGRSAATTPTIARHGAATRSAPATGTRPAPRQRPATGARPGTSTGGWRDLTDSTSTGWGTRPDAATEDWYDPVTGDLHHRGNQPSRSLPMYPSWTTPDDGDRPGPGRAEPDGNRTGGRHAAPGDNQASWTGRPGDLSDTGTHHRIEIEAEPEDRRGPRGGAAPQREVGGRRRHLEPEERRAAGRPDLTVIPGGSTGTDWHPAGPSPRDVPRQGHLRAVPGEQYGR